MEYSDFRRSDDIEDRRKTRFVPTPGVFGNGIDLGNVFDNGLLTGLDPSRDFVQSGETPLGIQLGVRDIGAPGGPALPQNSPAYFKPMGAIGDVSGAAALPVAQDNGRSAFDFFIGQGLAPHQAAGIVGNLQGESGQGLNPNAVNKGDGRDGSDSIGIGQWNGTRAQALKDYAASKNVPWNDLNTQLEFMHSELKGPEAKAYAGLTAAKTPEEAGQAMLAYERPKDWNKPGAHPERGQYAAKVFATYGGQPQPVTPVAPAIAPQAAPLSLIPQQAPPIFAPPVQQPQAPQEAPSMFASMPAEQMAQAPPIFAPPRKPVDLSKLRAAFARPTGGFFNARG